MPTVAGPRAVAKLITVPVATCPQKPRLDRSEAGLATAIWVNAVNEVNAAGEHLKARPDVLKSVLVGAPV
jgi:hypothetical protein